MASKTVSPTARLLRHSRLFSLPPQLSRPAEENGGAAGNKTSNTATLPHPINAAITTTPQGLARGDWGLKRPLPLKSTTKTSTPYIRVKQVDSINHITEYESAADHVLTLKKWQEMNLPIFQPNPNQMTSGNPNVSVFEDKFQATSKMEESESEKGAVRWKFGGPWLAGMSEGEFETYVNKQVRKRRSEFEDYIRDWLVAKKAMEARSGAMAKGEDLNDKGHVDLTDAELESGVARLRRVNSDLWPLVWKFLDLPGTAPVRANNSFEDDIDRYISSETGPPRTHPSAGLSYLRTNAIIPNHPILGPVRSQPPVEGRILKHASPTRKSNDTMVGVGGVVGKREGLGGVMTQGKRDVRNQEAKFYHDLPKGAKTWVQARHASIDSDGRIKLHLEKADRDALAIWENRADGGTAEGDATGSLPATAYSSDIAFGARPQQKGYDKFMGRP